MFIKKLMTYVAVTYVEEITFPHEFISVFFSYFIGVILSKKKKKSKLSGLDKMY